MGAEFVAETMEDLCAAMCDNVVPKHKEEKMKETKYLFNERRQTPEGMVSVSQLQSFMSCPKKWEYGYIENLAPRVDRPYLTIGKLCHKGMQEAMRSAWMSQKRGEDQHWYSWRDSGIKAIEREWQEYVDSNTFLEEEMSDIEKTLEDAISIFSQAYGEFEPWKYKVLSVVNEGIEIPALELHFVIPCAGSKGLHGFIDAILLDTETGFTWCTDYKFRKALSPDEEEAENIQNAVYTRACMKMGIKITGTMTWQHVNTPAATPTMLSNGKVSRAKIKTTWEKYANFCKNHGIDPEEYRDEMEPKLADIEWFRPTYEYRNAETVTAMWNDCVVPAAYAVKSAYKKKNRRNIYPWNCKMCQFKELCQAELRNHDADFIRQSSFVVREHGRNAKNTQ